MESKDSVTVGPLTFRWCGDSMTVTTPDGQAQLDAAQSLRLLIWLYDEQRENIWAARDGVPEWARPDQLTEPVRRLASGAIVRIYEESKEDNEEEHR